MDAGAAPSAARYLRGHSLTVGIGPKTYVESLRPERNAEPRRLLTADLIQTNDHGQRDEYWFETVEQIGAGIKTVVVDDVVGPWIEEILGDLLPRPAK